MKYPDTGSGQLVKGMASSKIGERKGRMDANDVKIT